MVVVALAVGMAGCSDIPEIVSTASPGGSPGVGSGSAVDSTSLRGAADRALEALRDLEDLDDQSYLTLLEMMDPDEGLVFSPYAYIQDYPIRLDAEEVERLGATASTTYVWGHWDGSGEPIELTFADYWERFVWDRDYTAAPLVAENEYQVGGNTLSNIPEFFGPDAQWVEYAFPSDDHTWSALRLVFREIDGTYRLLGVVHDQWTI